MYEHSPKCLNDIWTCACVFVCRGGDADAHQLLRALEVLHNWFMKHHWWICAFEADSSSWVMQLVSLLFPALYREGLLEFTSTACISLGMASSATSPVHALGGYRQQEPTLRSQHWPFGRGLGLCGMSHFSFIRDGAYEALQFQIIKLGPPFINCVWNWPGGAPYTIWLTESSAVLCIFVGL